eukprot:1038349-Rhodomonas_salina.4
MCTDIACATTARALCGTDSAHAPSRRHTRSSADPPPDEHSCGSECEDKGGGRAERAGGQASVED